LIYEEKLIKNGSSPTQVMYGLISMRVELGGEKNELLACLTQQRYILPLMRMEIRSILKSLGGRSTTVKLQEKSLKK
jgi:hypothetical protein